MQVYNWIDTNLILFSFIYSFWFGVTHGSTQGLLPLLCSAVSPGGVRRNNMVPELHWARLVSRLAPYLRHCLSGLVQTSPCTVHPLQHHYLQAMLHRHRLIMIIPVIALPTLGCHIAADRMPQLSVLKGIRLMAAFMSALLTFLRQLA